MFSTYDLYWVVGLDEADRFFLYDSVGLADPCRPYGFPLDPIARSFQSDVYCGSEYPEFRDVLGPGYFDVFLYAEAEVSVIVEASLVDFVGNCFQGSLQEFSCLISPQSDDRCDGLSLSNV